MASSYIPQSGMTPDEVKQNRGLGQYLMRQNSGSEPLGHWTQALGKVLGSASGRMWSDRATEGEKEGRAGANQLLAQALQGGDLKGSISQGMSNPWAAETFTPIASGMLKDRAHSESPMGRLEMDAKRASIAASGQSLAHSRALHGPQLEQAKIAAAAAKRDFDTPKPTTFDLGEGHVRYDQRRMPDGSVQAVPIATGGVKQDSASKKAVWEAQDELPSLQGTVEALKRAKELNNQAYTGYTAGARGAVMTGMPFGVGQTGAANATTEYQNIINQQAIEAMSRTLKGATTDKEMGQFLKIIGDLNQPPELRARVLDRLLSLADRQMQIKNARIKELGGRMPEFVGGDPAQPQARTSAERKVIGGKSYIKVGEDWFEQ